MKSPKNAGGDSVLYEDVPDTEYRVEGVMTPGATCAVCGTDKPEHPGWGMTLHAFDGEPRTFYTCHKHDDAIFIGIDGYDRAKNPARMVVRRMTRDEAKALRRGSEVQFVHYGDTKKRRDNRLGTENVIKRAKVTSVHTWKTRDDVEVRWHYGMSARGHAQSVDGTDGLMNDLVVVL